MVAVRNMMLSAAFRNLRIKSMHLDTSANNIRQRPKVANNKACVDVIIPVFNGQLSIRAALNSVLTGQGGAVRRVIVIDDGSRDETAKIVQSLKNPIIELIRTPNQGVSVARNLGVEKATAEWIAFLDADDVWMPGKLENQLHSAQKFNADFICGSASPESTMVSSFILLKLLARGNFIATSSVLVKRNVLNQIRPVFTPNMTFAEDYLVWLQCITLTQGYYISAKMIDYVISEKPRYRWGQILFNLLMLNIRYARFLRHSNQGWLRNISLTCTVAYGTLLTIVSTLKRFLT